MSPEIVIKDLNTGELNTKHVGGRVALLCVGTGRNSRDVLQVGSDELLRVKRLARGYSLIEVRSTDGSVNNIRHHVLSGKHPEKQFEVNELRGVLQPAKREDPQFRILSDRFGGVGKKRKPGLRRNRKKTNLPIEPSDR